MVGIELQSSIANSTGTDSTWGIERSNFLNILDVNQSYTTHLYLL